MTMQVLHYQCLQKLTCKRLLPVQIGNQREAAGIYLAYQSHEKSKH